MTTSTRRPERFVIVEEPYYSSGETRFSLREESGPVPGIGDVVETDLDDHDGIDEDGDRAVLFNGKALDIADAVLVSIDKVIRDRTAPATVSSLFDARRTPHAVTLRAKVIRPTVLAELLSNAGLDANTVEEVIALAVLRSTDDDAIAAATLRASLRRIG